MHLRIPITQKPQSRQGDGELKNGESIGVSFTYRYSDGEQFLDEITMVLEDGETIELYFLGIAEDRSKEFAKEIASFRKKYDIK